MGLADIAAGIEEEQRWGQFARTWGHLFPEPGDHPGVIVVAHSQYGDQGVIVVQQAFQDVEDSPWFYEALTYFACRAMRQKRVRHVTKVGTVQEREILRSVTYTDIEYTAVHSPGIWEFQGVLRVHKNGKLRFAGKWTKMALYPGRIPATRPRSPLLEVNAALQGKRKYETHYVESDNDYVKSNQDALIRFLDTMNERRRENRCPTGKDGKSGTESR